MLAARPKKIVSRGRQFGARQLPKNGIERWESVALAGKAFAHSHLGPEFDVSLACCAGAMPARGIRAEDKNFIRLKPSNYAWNADSTSLHCR